MAQVANKLALLCCLMCGCVAVPIPHRETSVRSRPAICKPDHADFIQNGVTTRAEVLLKLGHPEIRWYGDRVVGYYWATSKLGVFFAAAAIPYGPAAAGYFQLPIRHHLLIEFDGHGVVRRHAVVVNARGDLRKDWKPSDSS